VDILDRGLVPDHSFPSGHVATAVVAYGGLFLLTLACTSAASRRWALPLLLLPVVVLLSRLYQGAHHLTDVLTSVGYASVWLLVLARLLLPRVSTAR
jgi:undecaprenyl-diphosphatase